MEDLYLFQSPIHRETHCKEIDKLLADETIKGFSPLFIGKPTAR